MRETFQISGVEVASGNRGPYHKVKTMGAGTIFCFDAGVGAKLQEHVGRTVTVEVDRTPNPTTQKVFPKITAFHGEADPSSVGDAAPVAAAAGGAPAGGSRGGASVPKKDPLGLVTSLRQTSLNAAVAYYSGAASDSGPSPGAVIETAKEFYGYLSESLPLTLS